MLRRRNKADEKEIALRNGMVQGRRGKGVAKVMDDPDWYHRPLSLEDMLAGGSLIIVATISILIYAVVMKVMRKQDKVLATHFQPWYVTFYYEPSSYGMLAEDFALYLSGGQSTMWTIIILVKRRRSAQKATMHMLNSHIESRLLLPCVINMVVFIVGQVVITHGTGEGKWAGFTESVGCTEQYKYTDTKSCDERPNPNL
ncbi:hypothetical protein TELCIR_10582 [Teladorsagia circumcincta]|uniref:Uncharacterized protein n=1 Tax=Teladorsagia circumcincta TaxID=45464 RepID=A0A2G9UBQ1_TELCI|nr:hypothetical protein TELCIR_10582 [Teladorsagia circumcincta]